MVKSAAASISSPAKLMDNSALVNILKLTVLLLHCLHCKRDKLILGVPGHEMLTHSHLNMFRLKWVLQCQLVSVAANCV